LFLGTEDGIHTGTLSAPLTRLQQAFGQQQVTKIEDSNSWIVAGTDSAGVWLSENDDQDWKAIGLPSALTWLKAKSDKELYAYVQDIHGNTASNKIVRSLDGGQTWKVIFTGYVSEFGFSKEQLVLQTMNSFYISANAGGTWQSISTNLGNSALYRNDAEGNLYAAFQDKVFKWSSLGLTWQQISTAPESGNINSLQITKTGKIAITSGGRLYTSDNAGIDWKLARESKNFLYLQKSNPSQYLFMSAENEGVYVSADEGKSWKLLLQPGPINLSGVLVDSRNKIWLSGSTESGRKSVLYTSDDGEHLRELTNPFLRNQIFLQPIESLSGKVVVPTQFGGIFIIK
jgi:hypothetical protein